MTPDELASRALLARILWWRKNLEKLDAYAVNTLLKTLASANANIRAQIKKDLPKVWYKLNYKEFRLWLGETTKPALDAVTDTITESWAVSATQSLNAYNSILSFDGQAKNIQQVPITVDTVKALAASSPFAGQKLSTLVQAIFHDGVAAAMLQCVDDAIKEGWGYKKVVKSLLNEAIDKGFQITQTQAITLSRSYIQQASVNAQMAVYEKNKDVVKGVKWTAILDNRVCGKCAALDGQTYAWDEQRPPLIAHPRCRCLWLPWLKSYRDLGLDIDDLEEAERNWVIREGGNIDAGGNRKILEAGTTKEDFPGWWKTLPYDEQVKSIGPTRTKLINDGRITWADLIDRNTGRYKTLFELGIEKSHSAMINLRGASNMEKLFGKISDVPESLIKSAEAVNPNRDTGIEYERNCQRCVPAYVLRRRGYDIEALGNPYSDRSGTSKREVFGGWEGFKNPKIEGLLGGGNVIERHELIEKLKEMPDGSICGIIWPWAEARGSHTIVCEKITGQLIFIDPQKGRITPQVLGEARKGYGYTIFRIDNLEIDEDFEWDEIIKKKSR